MRERGARRMRRAGVSVGGEGGGQGRCRRRPCCCCRRARAGGGGVLCPGTAALLPLFPPPRKCLQASLSSTAAGYGGRAGAAPVRGPRRPILARGRRAAPAPRALPRAAAASLVSRGKNQEGRLLPPRIYGEIDSAAESRTSPCRTGLSRAGAPQPPSSCKGAGSRRHAPGRGGKRAVGARRGRFGGKPPPPAAFGSDPPPPLLPRARTSVSGARVGDRGMGARRRRGSRTAGTGGRFRDGEGFAAGTGGRFRDGEGFAAGTEGR